MGSLHLQSDSFQAEDKAVSLRISTSQPDLISEHLSQKEDELCLCVYVSSATELYDEHELEQLLEVTRRNNDRDGITGMLLYAEGCFIQAFEGPITAVDELRARIQRDPHHKGMIELMNKVRPSRVFGSWSMGFKRISTGSVDSIPGLSDYLKTGTLQAPINDRQIMLLLDSFRQTNS